MRLKFRSPCYISVDQPRGEDDLVSTLRIDFESDVGKALLSRGLGKQSSGNPYVKIKPITDAAYMSAKVLHGRTKDGGRERYMRIKPLMDKSVKDDGTLTGADYFTIEVHQGFVNYLVLEEFRHKLKGMPKGSVQARVVLSIGDDSITLTFRK